MSENLKETFDNIQGVFNCCINYSYIILVNGLSTKFSYLDTVLLEELEKQEYLRISDELMQLYMHNAVLSEISNYFSLYPLGNYERIYCFFDNDTAGIRAVQELYKECSFRVRDSSRIYSGYKDLNDYLCEKRLVQSVDLTQQTKQSRTVKQTDRQEQQPAKKKRRGFRM